MKKLFPLSLLFLAHIAYSQTYTVLDSLKGSPISYATISFGNGNGTFADADGSFQFSKKWYPDIDTLYISALSHKERALATASMPKRILLAEDVSELKEVVIVAEKKRKYKVKKRPSQVHNDYFK